MSGEVLWELRDVLMYVLETKHEVILLKQRKVKHEAVIRQKREHNAQRDS